MKHPMSLSGVYSEMYLAKYTVLSQQVHCRSHLLTWQCDVFVKHMLVAAVNTKLYACYKLDLHTCPPIEFHVSLSYVSFKKIV